MTSIEQSLLDTLFQPIDVYLIIKIFDQDIEDRELENLKKAIGQFAQACGYSYPEILEEKRGSFFAKIRYKIASIITPKSMELCIEDGKELYVRGRENLKSQLDKVGVESTQQIAEAIATLLKAIEPFQNTVILSGKLIIIKQTKDDNSQVYVKTVSLELQHKLESTPHLLDSPQTIIDYLNSQEALPDPLQVGPDLSCLN